MHEIERHANDAWKSGKRCIAAHDFLRVNVPIEPPTGPSSTRQQTVGTANESASEWGEGRKRRRSEGSIDHPVAEEPEARNSESAHGGRGRGSHFRARYPNTRGRGFYRNAGHSRGTNGNGGMGRPF